MCLYMHPVHIDAPNVYHKADEEAFVTMLATLTKLEFTLKHHMTGCTSAKKKFEAMLE
jgi:hypothetical protein